MRANEDGSVALTAVEAKAMSLVLKLGRELAEQLEAEDQISDKGDGTLELRLLEQIDLLEELGVSPEELTEKVDSGRKPG